MDVIFLLKIIEIRIAHDCSKPDVMLDTSIMSMKFNTRTLSIFSVQRNIMYCELNCASRVLSQKIPIPRVTNFMTPWDKAGPFILQLYLPGWSFPVVKKNHARTFYFGKELCVKGSHIKLETWHEVKKHLCHVPQQYILAHYFVK
jgi:hypothetical protein